MGISIRLLSCVVIAFASILMAYADGSKDMYYSGVNGNRAYLKSGNPSNSGHDKFLNFGVHYVYANENEVIAVASSAQGIGTGRIVVTSPDGDLYRTELGSEVGRIQAKNSYTARMAELAGPGVGYQPFEIPVETGKAGIWKVEFLPTGGEDRIEAIRADADWEQDHNSRCIAAWDVSVRKTGSSVWLQGRVYTNLLNLYIYHTSIPDENGGLFAVNYVLTKDGYIYKVDANGSHPAAFTYFVNNTGILNPDGTPSYKSSNDGFVARVHDPNLADNATHITHKMFYTFPDLDMPQFSRGPVPIGNTWLVSNIQIAEIQNVSFWSIEGNQNYVNTKGAYVQFETNYAGRYKIVISPQSSLHDFPKREIIYDAAVGVNNVWWNGLDGAGHLVPVGSGYPVSISVALIEGEIHFPYFDMEINPNGIKVERINRDNTFHSYPIMYWDDREITQGLPSEMTGPIVNLEGIPSGSGKNGSHKWGTYRTTSGQPGTNMGTGSYSFGNDKAMDTWSYAAHVEEEITENITVKEADLEVVSLQADKDVIELGEEVSYVVTVKNKGPVEAVEAKFEYDLPEWFVIREVAVSSNCGTVLSSQQTHHTIRSVLTLPEGCELVYRIKAVADLTDPTVPDATCETYGIVEARAGIVRPLGYVDPDATSPDVDKDHPGTASEECQGDCNNIKTNREVFLLQPVDERGALAVVKTVVHLDANQNGFQEEGEFLEYRFTIRNTGLVAVSNMVIEDKLLGDQLIDVGNVVLQPGEEVVVQRQYRITVADVARKYVENTALIRGKNPCGFEVKDVSGTQFDNDLPTKIDIDTRPNLQLTKKVVNQGTGQNGQFTIGDKIVYRFEIKHEGDLAVEAVYIRDPKISSQDFAMDPGVLSNESITYELDYTVTVDDIRAGRIENTAVVLGRDEKYHHIIEDLSGQTFGDDLPTITELAKPPRGIDDRYEVYQGNVAWLDILENDMEGSSTIDRNSIEVIVLPNSGTIVVKDGKIRYTPAEGVANANDRLVYRISDQSRLQSEDTEVYLAIVPTVPVAVDDHYTLRYNHLIRFDAYINDYVEYSEIVKESLEVTSYPQHGEIVALGNGTLEYKAHYNFTGYDELKYRIQDKNGNWSEEATITIKVVGFFLPNVITPNGDGENDTFEVLGLYKFDRVELEIINRFGKTIFQSSDYKNDWQVPESLPEGTYFYIFKGISRGESAVARKGTVLVVRKRSGY